MGFKKDFRKLHGLTVGGAVLTKSTDLLAHARDIHALQGDVSGFVGVGVAGAISSATMDIALGGFKKKRKRKRR